MARPRGTARRISAAVAPHLPRLAPTATAGFVHQALALAIAGTGPLPGAAFAADRHLAENGGDLDRAVHDVIEGHLRMAGLQGFVTNLGGLVTMAVTVPANVAGLALIQSRMVAGIAHLHGYDLDDPRTRTAVLTSLLGEEDVLGLVKRGTLPGTPRELAGLAHPDPELDQRIAGAVASELLARAAGKRLATAVGRRVPVVGGLVGAGTDAYVTWQIGRYVDREFLPRRRRGRRR